MIQIENNWYVLLGDQKFGPYEYKVMIQMLQSHQLMDYNYVWAPHLESWTQVFELTEFSKDRFAVLMQNPELKSAFIERKSNRTEVLVPLMGHNHIRFFDGVLTSISESGGLCLLNTPLIQVGDQMKIHVKSNQSNSVSFNIECEVIRKNFTRERLNSKSGLYYAVRFHDIQKVGIDQIRKWSEVKAS